MIFIRRVFSTLSNFLRKLLMACTPNDRSSRSQMFFKIGVLKHFSNFTEKQLCWSLFLIKLHARGSANLLKRESNTTVFPVKFTKFLRAPFLQNTSAGCFWNVKFILQSLPFRRHIRTYLEHVAQNQPPEVFYKKAVLKIFRNTHMKTPMLKSLFNKVAGLKS